MIAVEYHGDLKEVQSDARLCALLSAPAQQAPFDRLEWWQGLADHCGLDPMIAVARSENALAVLPLAGGQGHLSSLSNWYTFRFRPLVSDHSDAPALLAQLAQGLASRAHRLTLTGVPDEDGSASAIEAAFAAADWIVKREPCDTNHVLPVNGRSYSEFLAARPGRLRTTLKRKSGKVDARVLTCFDADAWDAYEAIYRESWKPEEGSPAFLRSFARAEGKAGRLRLGVAYATAGEFAGQAIAAQMWTVEGNTAFIHKLSHREAARPLSPGSVLSAALVRQVIDSDKVSLIDFGTGDDPYKRDWMEQARPRYRLDMFRPMAPQNWLMFAKSGLLRLAGRDKQG